MNETNWMKETDWEIFKQIREQALEQFYRESLTQFQTITENSGLSLKERYDKHYEAVIERDQLCANLFDNLCRSKAALQLLQMRHQGLVDAILLEKLSEEFRHGTDPSDVFD
ncbi:hypothetical protein C2869_10980 [Saccharobesus litoralis]|uniref:Uncharacterized protein n=1 Tax=Saccharobesus litoralis TaxID=2172099 RepID=A0A2S0VRT2_9ALTE|nr:hypothetical protein [Saccharobesus litoralis]AWB66926.1 hypothetical protein C2869_10980 [Saccharobesus litoralis]